MYRLSDMCKLLSLWLMVALTIGNVPTVYAQQAISTENQIKAGYLLHIPSYVRWPSGEPMRIRICIYGQDPFGAFIDEMVQVKPLTRAGIPIVIERLQENDAIDTCSVIYVPTKAMSKRAWALTEPSHATLTVSDYNGFINQGGMIELYQENNHVRIAINLNRVKQADLEISAELLKLVNITRSSPEAGSP